MFLNLDIWVYLKIFTDLSQCVEQYIFSDKSFLISLIVYIFLRVIFIATHIFIKDTGLKGLKNQSKV